MSIGVLNVAVNPPVEFDAKLLGEVTIVFPSKLMVIGKFGAKFEPLTVRDVPAGPLKELTVKLDGITLNVVEEKLKKLSATTIVLVPDATPFGIIKDAPPGMLPDESVT